MKIIPEYPEYKPMTSLKKGFSGGVVASLGLLIMSCFHGLSPEQQQAGCVVSIGVLEVVRNALKKKFPRFLSWF
jgi:hypothetical protein